MFEPIDETKFKDIDFYELNREMDRTKSAVFLGKNAAFLGSISCSLELVWTTKFPTAATNGKYLWWNPHWFLSLSKEMRITVYMHELWHVARLHTIRFKPNEKVWNWALDIKINDGLRDENYTFDIDHWRSDTNTVLGYVPYIDRSMVEDDIYDLLMKMFKGNAAPSPWDGKNGAGDVIEVDKDAAISNVNTVVAALHQAKLAGEAGTLPGDIELLVERFLAPVIPWETVLEKFFSDLLNQDYSWARPNRRYQDMYLPSLIDDDGKLEHLMYFQDVSGSVSDHDILRFNSELKYVKDKFNPQKMTVAQFDTRITKVDVWEENDDFNRIKIEGRGGTDLRCVRAMIEKEKPTAAIIFSDLFVPPMEPLTQEIPIIWICVGNKGASVPFGKLLHID